MRKFLTSGFVMVAGMVSLPANITHADPKFPTAEHRTDGRLEVIQRFFEECDCPARDYAHVFLKEADHNDLDWRLLPSISFVESTGGKNMAGNNLFGWASGRAEFPSLTASIHAVAYYLANSPRYRDKDTDGILRIYNPNADYGQRVKAVMRRISPLETISE